MKTKTKSKARKKTRSNAHRPSLALVGPGNLAYGVGIALRQAGYKVSEIISRDEPASRQRGKALAKRLQARAVTLQSIAAAALTAEVVWICVTDHAIRPVAEQLAHVEIIDWRGKIVFHSSAALRSSELEALHERGAHVASVHPMMTFVSGEAPRLQGVSFAVEGDAKAVASAKKIAIDLGGDPFDIHPEAKVLYHAMGSFSSPLLIATLAAAEQVGKAAGLSDRQVKKTLAPMIRRTVENYFKNGSAAAFSGPINRGNAATLRRHLQELEKTPDAREVYLALAGLAVNSLPVKNKEELLKVLDEAKQRL